MKKKMLKILALLASFLVTVGLGACEFVGGGSSSESDTVSDSSIDSDETPKYSEGLQYDLAEDGKSYLVHGIGCCTDTDIIIPPEYEGLPVEKIGMNAFDNCGRITSVVIPEGVTCIDIAAFRNCEKLAKVTLPKSLKKIGHTAFERCVSLEKIEIPEKVESIGGYVFYGCTRLEYNGDGVCKYLGNAENPYFALIETLHGNIQGYELHADTKVVASRAFIDCAKLSNVKFPDGLVGIGEEAFINCVSLTSVVVPEGVVHIEMGAFDSCSALTSARIPSTATDIGDRAFYLCSNLTNITVAEGNTVYKDIDGNLYSKDGTVLWQYAVGKKDTRYVIPNGVVYIYHNAFETCESLTSVVIPNSVTYIGHYAFNGCGLTSVVIPDSVTYMGERIFSYCDAMESIEIPGSVEWIEGQVFYPCNSLTTITYKGTMEKLMSIVREFDWFTSVPTVKVICADGTFELDDWVKLENGK